MHMFLVSSLDFNGRTNHMSEQYLKSNCYYVPLLHSKKYVASIHWFLWTPLLISFTLQLSIFQQRVKPPSNLQINFEVILGYDNRNRDSLCAMATVQSGTIKILIGN